MSFLLRGVIGAADAIRPIGEDLRQTIVPLNHEWWLMPWTSEAFDTLGASDGEAEVAGLHFCHSSLASTLQRRSMRAPVAYVEAECWAGQCEHGAVVFKGGEIVWLSEFGPVLSQRPGRRTPIGEALSRIGVEVDESAFDEFDSVGLGRNRHTEDWLPPSSR